MFLIDELKLSWIIYHDYGCDCDGDADSRSFVGTYGINYGRIADNLPAPEDVVRLLKLARIRNVKIYDADHKVLDAFRGSGLNLVVAIPNEFLKDMAANPSKAMDWLNENIQPYHPSTRIVGITVGNEVLGGGDTGLAEALVGAVANVHDALKMLRLDRDIELTTPHSEAVFSNSYPPSACVFREDLMVYLRPLLDFFSRTGAPFYVNAYPFLAYMSDPSHIDINYALFKPNSGIVDPKTNLHYDNMFEAQLDAAYFALEAAGYPGMEVRVAETGWASQGDTTEAGANMVNAVTYNRNLRKRLFLRKGTPYRPDRVAKAYIFALFNEDLKPGPTTERHYGLFKPDGSVSINIGLKGLVSSAPPLFSKVRISICFIIFIFVLGIFGVFIPLFCVHMHQCTTAPPQGTTIQHQAWCIGMCGTPFGT